MSELDLSDCDNLEDFLPSNEKIQRVANFLEDFTRRYSTNADEHDEGFDLNNEDELIAACEKIEGVKPEIDPEDSGDEELFVSDTEDNQVVPAGDTYSRLTNYFSPEFIEALQEAHQKRVEELSRLNLPYWNVCAESSSVKESSSEVELSGSQLNLNSINNLNMQNFSARARKLDRQSEAKRVTSSMCLPALLSSPPIQPTDLLVQNFKINGLGDLTQDLDSSSSNRLPASIQELMKSKMNFTLRVREREYDFIVNGESFGQISMQNSSLNNTKQIETALKAIEDVKAIDQVAYVAGDKRKVEAKSPEKAKISKVQEKIPVEKSKLKKKDEPELKIKVVEQKKTKKVIVISSDSEIEKENEKEVKKPVKTTKEKPKSQIKLEDISCGSSCSTVTSDEDAKFFNPKKYNEIREEKKLKHRKKKLSARQRAMQSVGVKNSEKNPTKIDEKIQKAQKSVEVAQKSSEVSQKSSQKNSDDAQKSSQKSSGVAQKSSQKSSDDAQKSSKMKKIKTKKTKQDVMTKVRDLIDEDSDSDDFLTSSQ